MKARRRSRISAPTRLTCSDLRDTWGKQLVAAAGRRTPQPEWRQPVRNPLPGLPRPSHGRSAAIPGISTGFTGAVAGGIEPGMDQHGRQPVDRSRDGLRGADVRQYRTAACALWRHRAHPQSHLSGQRGQLALCCTSASFSSRSCYEDVIRKVQSSLHARKYEWSFRYSTNAFSPRERT